MKRNLRKLLNILDNLKKSKYKFDFKKNYKKLTLEKYKNKKKFGILIAARSDSKRLPRKHFKILNDKLNLSVLDYCIKKGVKNL